MAAGGTVLPFVRGIDLTKNDFKVSTPSLNTPGSRGWGKNTVFVIHSAGSKVKLGQAVKDLFIYISQEVE